MKSPWKWAVLGMTLFGMAFVVQFESTWLQWVLPLCAGVCMAVSKYLVYVRDCDPEA